jgi:hypothetical protein
MQLLEVGLDLEFLFWSLLEEHLCEMLQKVCGVVPARVGVFLHLHCIPGMPARLPPPWPWRGCRKAMPAPPSPPTRWWWSPGNGCNLRGNKPAKTSSTGSQPLALRIPTITLVRGLRCLRENGPRLCSGSSHALRSWSIEGMSTVLFDCTQHFAVDVHEFTVAACKMLTERTLPLVLHALVALFMLIVRRMSKACTLRTSCGYAQAR